MKSIDHNVQTGEITERDLTTAEIDDFKLRSEMDAMEAEKEKQLKSARLAVLTKLGLTEDDIKILGL